MEIIDFQLRNIQSKDWAILLFAIATIIIAINKTLFGKRFSDFIRLATSDKYLKSYKNTSSLTNGFTIGFIFLYVLNISFLILIILHQYNIKSKYDWMAFAQVFTLYSAYISCKYIIEKIVSDTFGIDNFTDSFLLAKINYKNFLGLILLPFNLILYFNSSINNYIVVFVVGLICLINLISYISVIKLNQNSIGNKIFYFILYLCTLEIAPYYFIYYLITNK